MEVSTLAHGGPVPATVSLMGLPVSVVSERETIDYVLAGLGEGRGGWIVTANLDILRQLHGSAELFELASSADLIVADGMPLVWAGALQGSPLPERVAGSALITSLTAAVAEAGASIFLLGGNPGTADGAVTQLTKLIPNADFAGTLCPPFGFDDDPKWLDRIEWSIRESGADVVYVALGFPKQERVIVELRARMPYLWLVPCGISFSLMAGEIYRAPALARRLGLEWTFRLAQEPKRLYRRYLVEGIPFFLELLWSAVMTRLRHSHAEAM
jgi:N-acetylglucosaminyldiphosphoundecaprenol N-acetyl-beta-D-mannosaminyltransferase